MLCLRDNVALRDATVDKTGCYLGFRFPDIRMAEQKLPVQIWNIDCVHVDDVDLTEAH